MNRARVAGDRLTSTSPSHPARSCGSTPADVPVAYLGGLSPATRAQFDFRRLHPAESRVLLISCRLRRLKVSKLQCGAQPRMELNAPLPRAFEGNVQTPDPLPAARGEGELGAVAVQAKGPPLPAFPLAPRSGERGSGGFATACRRRRHTFSPLTRGEGELGALLPLALRKRGEGGRRPGEGLSAAACRDRTQRPPPRANRA